MSLPKIFVRERRKVGTNEKKPRFFVVGVAGTDLAIRAKHIRKGEIEKIAEHLNAEVVYLDIKKDDDDDNDDDDDDDEEEK